MTGSFLCEEGVSINEFVFFGTDAFYTASDFRIYVAIILIREVRTHFILLGIELIPWFHCTTTVAGWANGDLKQGVYFAALSISFVFGR
ncbi:hypothetical protein HMPREF2572_01490 [Neisseria sp. HMSC064E01]|nr:hypothetical protein HMPREF2572_01490 [Neisseria sp. HMSC064E01]